MVEKYNHCLVNLKPYYTNAQFYAFPSKKDGLSASATASG